jgi:hypothetical protein
MYLAFCYNVKPRMMNNILFTKKPNKQKNIENAVIYCIHIPLSQLITLTAQFKREKWFNIGGNRSIVTRYRLDSQFHCSYLDSRGVPGKPREIITLSFPMTSFPVMQLPVAPAHTITSGTPS